MIKMKNEEGYGVFINGMSFIVNVIELLMSFLFLLTTDIFNCFFISHHGCTTSSSSLPFPSCLTFWILSNCIYNHPYPHPHPHLPYLTRHITKSLIHTLPPPFIHRTIGLGAKLLQTVSNAALTSMIQERVHRGISETILSFLSSRVQAKTDTVTLSSASSA